MKRSFLQTALILGLTVSLTGCATKEISDAPALSTGVVTTAPEQTEEPTTEPAPIENPTLRMVAVGDNLVQTGVYRAAQKWSTNGTYDFTNTYANIKDIIQAGDISVINQETLIANDQYEVSGTNFNFNSPTQLGSALMDVGFNVITMSNNHLLDKGEGGLLATLDYWDSVKQNTDVTVVGAYRDEADMNNLRIREVDGMRVAFLAYTDSTNGYSLPSGSAVKILYTSDAALMEQQIRAAKEAADAVVVSMHWGAEDTHTVTQDRRDLAQSLINWGADVILGTHPHTAQTMEYLTRADGTQGFVFYSLGNFVSAQTDNFNAVGEIADFRLTLDLETEQVRVEDVQVIPVITHYDDGRFSNLRLYPYSMYTPELANSHGLPVAPKGTAKAFNMDVINKIIENNIPAEFRKLD